MPWIGPPRKPDQPAERDEPKADHLYIPTVTGHCARKLCGRKQEAHPVVMRLAEPDPVTGCVVDHNTLPVSVNLFVDRDAEMMTRAQCVVCSVMLEPKMATGIPVGRADDPGRGDLTERMKKRLRGWYGWWRHNGGDEWNG